MATGARQWTSGLGPPQVLLRWFRQFWIAFSLLWSSFPDSLAIVCWHFWTPRSGLATTVPNAASSVAPMRARESATRQATRPPTVGAHSWSAAVSALLHYFGSVAATLSAALRSPAAVA